MATWRTSPDARTHPALPAVRAARRRLGLDVSPAVDSVMRWQTSWRYDPRGASLADRHYSRLTPGSPGFVGSGFHLVLITPEGDALWVSFRQPEPTHRFGKDAWMCSMFRNESPHLSSELIREAIAATRHAWGDPPESGMVTFVNADKVRRKRDPGRCFRKAGFKPVGHSGTGLVALRLFPEDFPPAEAAIGQSQSLWGDVA